MEPSIPFHTLVQFGEAEGLRNEKNRMHELPLKNNIVTSKLKSQNLSSETYDSNPEFAVYTNK